MEWINIFGAVFIAVIMIPNIIYALKCRDGFENKWNNKGVEVVEQIGRFGCFVLYIELTMDILKIHHLWICKALDSVCAIGCTKDTYIMSMRHGVGVLFA